MKLTGKEKVSYGLGAVGKDMVYMLSASYILYYYQDILGVSAFAMGVILLAARVLTRSTTRSWVWLSPRQEQDGENSARGFSLERF